MKNFGFIKNQMNIKLDAKAGRGIYYSTFQNVFLANK